MFVFPQLSTGALVQYPVQKRRTERTILNVSEDGHVIVLYDPSAQQVRWDLAYIGLTDQESANIQSFFQQCEGSLQSFLFLDPTENLLAYSEDLSQPSWTYNSLLSVTPGIADPFGTSRASRITNMSAADLSVAQTVTVPGAFSCAFSVYLRGSQTSTVTLSRTDGSNVSSPVVIETASGWVRANTSSAFASSASFLCTFSLSIPSGATVDVFGFQVEAQPSHGTYIPSTNETGVHPDCRFDMDQLTVTSTGPGQSSTRVSILSKASQ